MGGKERNASSAAPPVSISSTWPWNGMTQQAESNSLTLERNPFRWLNSRKSVRFENVFYQIRPTNTKSLKSGPCYPVLKIGGGGRMGFLYHLFCSRSSSSSSTPGAKPWHLTCKSLDWSVHLWHLRERWYLQVCLLANGLSFLVGVGPVSSGLPSTVSFFLFFFSCHLEDATLIFEHVLLKCSLVCWRRNMSVTHDANRETQLISISVRARAMNEARVFFLGWGPILSLSN